MRSGTGLPSLFLDRASDVAGRVDAAFLGLLALSGFLVCVVAGLILWFGVRYRASTGRKARDLPQRRVEIGWASALIVLTVVLFFVGAGAVLVPRDRPSEGMPVYIVGKQWMWKVQHPGGRREINELHLPAGRPVRLILSSQDVIHSFYVPAFRLKQDALPNRYTALGFTPTKSGVYHLFCAEYCGSEHSRMIGRVVVMPPERYADWLSSGAESTGWANEYETMAGEGAAVVNSLGCGACHGRQQTPLAPRLDGIYGRPSRMETGELVTVDAEYIRQSILRPDARIVAGYGPESRMPSYHGRITEAELNAVVEYIRSIRHGWPEDGGEP